MITSAISDSEATQIILDEFCSQTGLADVEHEIRQGSTRSVLVLRMANPTERFFSVLQNVLSKLDDQPQTVTIERRTAKNRLDSPEARYFLRTLAESLNVSRNTFKDDFFARYTNSGSNAETQITAAANHVVFGRRGAGKSSLLLYAMRTRERRNLPSAWIDMQVFEKRTDYALVLDVIREMLQQTTVPPTKTIDRASALSEVDRLRKSAEAGDEQIRQLLPQVRSVISSSSVIAKDTFVFLDDFHVLDISMQPKLLGYLYSIIRGTSTFLKLSSIETLTRTWDAKTHTGLQIPHDAQVIRLDYNLTMPDKAYSHIEGILDAHAVYCGLPSVKYLCTSPDVISRLVWVSAGVPRDALNLFAQAMTKGVTEGRGQVSVTNINVAASEMVSQKNVIWKPISTHTRMRSRSLKHSKKSRLSALRTTERMLFFSRSKTTINFISKFLN